ncbi:unnamed protein product [Psylliodes chrysocephalus]|uniref:CRAL-TRIO domain-containing protein n=1 Tax=Psylliodes chrysocephalus TaxID=3402493 RepID=A0A9P0GAG2_9CUCU|nr:unnamed protein product [Psylliodes chrysocephala]
MEKKPLLHIDKCKIRKHWGKTDSEVEEDIETLKKWIKTMDFPEMPTDHMIEFFLTNCKYNIDKTKINLETFYSIRKMIPEIYECSNPKLPEIMEAWDMGCYLPLPTAAEGLYRISLVNISPNTSNFNVQRYFANFMNVYEIRICEDLVLSEIVVVDYNQLKWSHIFHFSPFLLRKMIMIMENVAKSRVKVIHIVRAPSYVSVIVNITKKFMKKKMADRIQTHKDFESLYDSVPQELLPSDYGGKEPPVSELIEMWKNKVMEYQDRFDMWDKVMQEDQQ